MAFLYMFITKYLLVDYFCIGHKTIKILLIFSSIFSTCVFKDLLIFFFAMTYGGVNFLLFANLGARHWPSEHLFVRYVTWSHVVFMLIVIQDNNLIFDYRIIVIANRLQIIMCKF